MATLKMRNLVLLDKWPGVPNMNLGMPANGWDNTKDNFVTTAVTDQPAYPLGTKIAAYTDNTNCPGWYTMMYLQYHCYSSLLCISRDFSDGKFWCSATKEYSTAQIADTTTGIPYYVVTSCVSGTTSCVTFGTPVAVPCATLGGDGTTAVANDYGDAYGWFWVGGVCPCKDATLMDICTGTMVGVDMTVDTILHRGPVFLCTTGSAGWLMAADESNFNDLTTGIVVSADPAAMAIGWTCWSCQ
jgi:hypothetical protein